MIQCISYNNKELDCYLKDFASRCSKSTDLKQKHITSWMNVQNYPFSE